MGAVCRQVEVPVEEPENHLHSSAKPGRVTAPSVSDSPWMLSHCACHWLCDHDTHRGFAATKITAEKAEQKKATQQAWTTPGNRKRWTWKQLGRIVGSARTFTSRLLLRSYCHRWMKMAVTERRRARVWNDHEITRQLESSHMLISSSTTESLSSLLQGREGDRKLRDWGGAGLGVCAAMGVTSTQSKGRCRGHWSATVIYWGINNTSVHQPIHSQQWQVPKKFTST